MFQFEYFESIQLVIRNSNRKIVIMTELIFCCSIHQRDKEEHIMTNFSTSCAEHHSLAPFYS